MINERIDLVQSCSYLRRDGRMNRTRFSALTVIVALVGCSQNTTSPTPPPMPLADRQAGVMRPLSGSGSTPITHVVIVFQENRTTNDLFNGLAGADTVRTGQNSYGQTVKLQPRLLTAPYDISHAHSAYETEWANGAGNGWNLVASSCKKGHQCPPADIRAYGYGPEKEVEPYFVMARRYAFGANMFQTNQGPSFPAHQYILSGTSTISDGSNLRAAENPRTPAKKNTGGCDSPKGSLVKLIDLKGNENQTDF